MPPLTEQQVRRIIQEELAKFSFSDRFFIYKNMQFADGVSIQTGLTNGLKIGSSTSEKIGFWNTTPVIQHSSTGVTAGFSAGAGGTAVKDVSTFTGNIGSEAFTIGDIVAALKEYGFLPS